MSLKSEETVDVRDGLSIADRKILSVLLDMIQPGKRFRRSSTITREIENRYAIDPDASYEILVDLTRDENTMYLVEGKGNFSYFPAAEDYTECGVSRLLKYLSYNGFIPSDLSAPFDMPLPFLLIAGTPGYCSIESKMPVHDPNAVMNAVYSLINNPDLTNAELSQIIKGPRLGIGGTIVNTEDMSSIYEKGYGEIHYSVSEETLNTCWCYFSVRDICEEYCEWYGHELSEPAGAEKGYCEITIQYNAFLTNGAETRHFSLKEILQEYIIHYKNLIQKHYGFTPDGEVLCKLLRSEVELMNNGHYSLSESEQHAELVLSLGPERTKTERK